MEEPLLGAEEEQGVTAEGTLLLESGPKDLVCEGVFGDVVVTVDVDVLKVLAKSATGKLVKEIWLQDVTAIGLRRRADRPSLRSEFNDDEEEDMELVVVSYPLLKNSGMVLNCCSSNEPVRGPKEELIFTSNSPEILFHWETALVGLISGKGQLDLCVSRNKKMFVIVSPVSGRGKGLRIFEREVRPILESSGIQCDHEVTRFPGDAITMVAEKNFSGYDGIVIVGGDGMIYEVVQGLKKRQMQYGDARSMSIPIGIVPSGSGNGMFASLQFKVEESADPRSAAVAIARGKVQAINLWQVDAHLGDGTVETMFATLSMEWGLISDLDVESEAFRCCGSFRFTLGGAKCVVLNREYHAKLFYLSLETNEWVEMEGAFQMIWAMNASHSAVGKCTAPGALVDNGLIEILVVRNCGRFALAKGLLGLDDGSHIYEENWNVIKTKEFKLEPSDGRIVIDGEVLPRATDQYKSFHISLLENEHLYALSHLK